MTDFLRKYRQCPLLIVTYDETQFLFAVRKRCPLHFHPSSRDRELFRILITLTPQRPPTRHCSRGNHPPNFGWRCV